MKLQFATRAETEERIGAWRPFFAIWPREVSEGQYRFFEWIERRGRFGKHPFTRDILFFEYRAKEKAC
jgi:hypothetical protein